MTRKRRVETEYCNLTYRGKLHDGWVITVPPGTELPSRDVKLMCLKWQEPEKECCAWWREGVVSSLCLARNFCATCGEKLEDET